MYVNKVKKVVVVYDLFGLGWVFLMVVIFIFFLMGF